MPSSVRLCGRLEAENVLRLNNDKTLFHINFRTWPLALYQMPGIRHSDSGVQGRKVFGTEYRGYT